MSVGLEGIRIVELAALVAGPGAGRLLADFGAEVIHVENINVPDGLRRFQAGQGGRTGVPSDINYGWENISRNKRSIAVDVSKDGGREIIYKLVQESDVFLTNMRPYELKKFKLEYETLSRLNPKIISAYLSGYGKEGPKKNTPGNDRTSYWARGGIGYVLSRPGMPVAGWRPSFGDNLAALALAYGIATALLIRERTGVGQEVYGSLLRTAIYQLSFDVAGALASGRELKECPRYKVQPPEEMLTEAKPTVDRLMNFYRENAPSATTNSYETKDGREVHLWMGRPDRYWAKFCKAIGREDLEHDPRFDSAEILIAKNAELVHILQEVFRTRTLAEWKARFDEVGDIIADPAQSPLEIANDPQARADGCFITYDHPTYGNLEMVANPIKLSKTPLTVRRPGPEFGEHNEEILLEHGYTWDDIILLKKQGVIT